MINKKIFIYIFLGLFITFTVLIAGFFIKIYQGGLKVNSVTDILQNRLGKKHNINFEESNWLIKYHEDLGLFFSTDNINIIFDKENTVKINKIIIDFNLLDILTGNLIEHSNVNINSAILENKSQLISIKNIDIFNNSKIFLNFDNILFEKFTDNKSIIGKDIQIETGVNSLLELYNLNKIFDSQQPLILRGSLQLSNFLPSNSNYKIFKEEIRAELSILKLELDYLIKFKRFENKFFNLNENSLIQLDKTFLKGKLDFKSDISNNMVLDFFKYNIFEREGNTKKLQSFLESNLDKKITLNLTSLIKFNEPNLKNIFSEPKLFTSGVMMADFIFDDNKNPSYLRGVLGYNFELDEFLSDNANLRGEIDFSNTSAFIRQINFEKKMDDALKINFTSNLSLNSDSLLNFNSEANEIDLEGRIRVSKTNHIYLENFLINNQDNVNLVLNGDLSERNLNLMITGDLIDLSKNKIQYSNKKEYYLINEKYNIKTQNVIFGDKVKASNFKATIDKSGNQLNVSSRAFNEDHTLEYYREKNDVEDINIIFSSDVTRFISNSHPARKLLSDGEIDMISKRNLKTLDAKTKIVINDFVLINTPASLKLLSLPSISGLVSIAEGEQGIRFGYGELSYIENKNEFKNISAYAVSDSLGLIMDGHIDRKNNNLEMQGEISPMYLVNAIIQNLPILGPIIVGQEGEGMFSIDFNLNGSTNDPEVESYPLTIIKPRIIERVFETLEN